MGAIVPLGMAPAHPFFIQDAGLHTHLHTLEIHLHRKDHEAYISQKTCATQTGRRSGPSRGTAAQVGDG